MRDRQTAATPMVLVASPTELPRDARVWGTGGWLQPDQREALDWLTLARLSGWQAVVTGWPSEGPLPLGTGNRWIVVARDPEALGDDDVALLASRLRADPIVVIARAASPDTPLARLAGTARGSGVVAGRRLQWTGAGARRTWQCRSELTAQTLSVVPGGTAWLTLEGVPVVAVRPVGRGVVATLAFHPSEWRDMDGAATAAIRHLLVSGALAPVAWLDWQGTLVLRMDDPGGAQNVFSRTWQYPKLAESDWTSLAADLRARNRRLSIGYVAGWVDDGDQVRGELAIAGRSPVRSGGAVHPSPLVRYRDLAGHAAGTLYDYESEFRGIQALRAAGAGDVELHGYTHLNPDTVGWASSPDRYDDVSWYRELGGRAEDALAGLPVHRHPLRLAIEAFARHFGVHPTTLICPGDQWTNEVLERALDLHLELVASYYLALRHDDRFCWTTHVCAPYLDEPDRAWFDAGLPVVGYFHDREPALEGINWIRKWLDEWQIAGADRMIDFRELAAGIGRGLALDGGTPSLRLRIDSGSAPDPVAPLRIGLRIPGGRLPPAVTAVSGGRFRELEIEPCDDECGRVRLPAGSCLGWDEKTTA